MRNTHSLVGGAVLAVLCACGAVSEARAAESFAITLDAPKETPVGQVGRAVLRLEPRGKYKVNLRYPTLVVVVAPAGVDLPKARLTAKDGAVSEKEARFEIAFTPKDAGEKVFHGEFRFSVCTAENCDIKKEKITWRTAAR